MNRPAIVLLIATIFACACGVSGAQEEACIEYHDYLHWAGRVDWEPAFAGFSNHDIAMSGDYAFTGQSPGGFVAWDVSHPASPVRLGSAFTGYAVLSIATAGSYAFALAAGLDSLFVLDITNPAAPSRATALFLGVIEPTDVAIFGEYAYVAASPPVTYPVRGDEPSFAVVNIADPLHPSVATTGGAMGQGASRIAAEGGYFYLATNEAGLLIFDYRNPEGGAVPRGQFVTEPIAGLAVSDGIAYVAYNGAGGVSGVIAIEVVSDPDFPVGLDEHLMTGFAPSDIALHGPRAFVSDRNGILHVLDISEPADLLLVSMVPIEGAECVAAGDGVVCTGRGSGGIDVVVARNQLAVEALGSSPTSDLAVRVELSEDHAFVASGVAGLEIFELSTAGVPTFAAGTTEGFTCAANDVVVANGLAYVTDGCGLRIFDVTKPALPGFLGGVDLGDTVVGLTVAGGYAYVAASSAGLIVVDVHDPAKPFVAGAEDTPQDASAVALGGTHAFVADVDGGVQVIDVSDPANPETVDEVILPAALGIAVAGNFAYVATETAGLFVLDVSDPSDVEMVGSLAWPPMAYDVVVRGPIAYVSAYWYGIWVVDVSVPATPRVIGQSGLDDFFVPAPSPGLLSGRRRAGDIRPSVPGLPDALAFGLSATRDFLAVGSYAAGLQIFPAQCPDETAPDLSIAVLQNPVLTSAIDVYVSSNETLIAEPVLTIGGTEIAIEAVSAPSGELYRARHALSGPGVVAIQSSGADLWGNEALSEFTFASFPVGREGGRMTTPDGVLAVSVPAGAIDRPAYLTLGRIEGRVEAPPGAPARYAIGPRGLELGSLEARFDLARLGHAGEDPSSLVIDYVDGGTGAPPIETFFDREGGALVASLPGPGRFEVRAAVGGAGSRALPRSFTLGQNHPNPFAPGTAGIARTTIAFALPRTGDVVLEIHDVTGRRVRTLVRGTLDRGEHMVQWDARDDRGVRVAPGLYVYRFMFPGGAESRKLLLLE